jgi:hypothetical protein
LIGRPSAQSAISAPVLMWQNGGCFAGPSCQTGWYSSPAVADLDSDGQPDVIWGASDVVALNGANGNLKWRAPNIRRVWSGLAVADLTGDGTLEVVAARDTDQLTVYDRLGATVWTRAPFGGAGELRTLAVADLDIDGQLEIIAGSTSSSFQLNAYQPNGTVRTGWPVRHAGEPGAGSGLWNQNVVVADVNGDGFKEVFTTTGSHYITGVDRNGVQLTVNPQYAPSVFWSQVGTAVDNAAEIRGWVNCGIEHRPNLSASAPAVADLNSDGVPEFITVGSVYSCGTPAIDLYQMPFIFKADRSRWTGSGSDWTVLPSPGAGSAPRAQDYTVIEDVQPNAVAADLDGDGVKEILYPSYSGKLHAYWLDKTPHGNWPFTIPTSGVPGDDFRFASEPVVADLNNDGHAEVIFTTWPKKATGRVGQLIVLDYLGYELHRIDLPAPANGATWNGGLAAPTIANIDADASLELVVGTAGSGVVAYKLPNTATARVLWGTGRANAGRTGVAAPPPPQGPPIDSTPPTVAITSPASSATVSGAVTINAAASDNVGVVGVQFRLDGANLGAEDMIAPYSASWNTTAAVNGAHVLTAVARDAIGNFRTSAAVPVTVFNDTTPPAVSLTSPANGASVSATTTISANASDDGIVAGVQFRLDGANIGAEDLTAPYSIAWDTTAASPGPHTLTAVARDGAGHFTTSAPVNVTVYVGSTIRIEESTTAVDLYRVWTRNYAGTPGGWSGGTVAFSVEAAARATLSFTGTGVRWIGWRGPVMGIATLYLDGVVVGSVDAYQPSHAVQAVLYTSPTLSLGPHTLAIEVTRTKNAASSDFFVAVDAFDVSGAPPDTTPPSVEISSPPGGSVVSGTATLRANASDNVAVVGVQFKVDGVPLPEATSVPYAVNWNTTTVADGPRALTAVARDLAGNTTTSAAVTVTVSNATPPPAATRVEDHELAIVYTSGTLAPGQPPDWFHGSRSRDWSDGTSTFNRSAGARATFTFTGTSVKWIGFRAPWAGIARVYVDGAFVEDVDLYSSSELVQTPVFTATNLPPGTHSIAVESTGQKNIDAFDYAVVVDAFDVTPGAPPAIAGTRSEESSATFGSGWLQGDTTRSWSGGTAAVSATPATPGARATFTFTGTSVRWIGLRGPKSGIAHVYLDGAFQATVDLYSQTAFHAAVYTVTTLARASHTLAIEVTGQKNAAAADSLIYVDAVDVQSRMEDDDSAITYSGNWIADTSRNWSGTSLQAGSGTVQRSASAGSRAELAFTGTSISWIGFRGPWLGMVDVSIDGGAVTRIDLYAPTESVQMSVFSAGGLAPGAHTLRIDVPGVKNPASAAAWIMVDAFDVQPASPAPAVTRHPDADPSIAYTADWAPAGVANFWSGQQAKQSITAGGRATFTFTGTSVRWLGERGFGTGVADVSIDGQFVARIDTSTSLQEVYQAVIFSTTGLAAGTHTLTIDVVGRNNEPAGATVQRVVVDAFDVY